MCRSGLGHRSVLRIWVFLLFLLTPLFQARAEEVCRFAGTTDYGGRLAIRADAAIVDGALRVDVRLQLDATPMWFVHTHYLMQEISFWQPDGLALLAVNSRYRVNSHIARQQWDVFQRGADGLDAFRVQGKTLADFRRVHPGFVQHWNPATFGQPWLQDYARAAAERRPDLDLRGMPASLRPPLALAFYWLRFLSPAGGVVPVFLPGFKAQKQVNLPIAPSTPIGMGQSVWQAPLHYPALSRTEASTALAWVSADRHLLQFALDLHGMGRHARGLIRLQGCTGTRPPQPHNSGGLDRKKASTLLHAVPDEDQGYKELRCASRGECTVAAGAD